MTSLSLDTAVSRALLPSIYLLLLLPCCIMLLLLPHTSKTTHYIARPACVLLHSDTSSCCTGKPRTIGRTNDAAGGRSDSKIDRATAPANITINSQEVPRGNILVWTRVCMPDTQEKAVIAYPSLQSCACKGRRAGRGNQGSRSFGAHARSTPSQSSR